MKFSKYNNPNRKKRKKLSRDDADIIAGKLMLLDSQLGHELPLSYYDSISDDLCGEPSRNLYN